MDRLADYFIRSEREPFISCGVWVYRWMSERTGIDLAAPDYPEWDKVTPAELTAIFRDYATRFALARRDIPSRGDVGLFASDERFVSKTGLAIGIFSGQGFWGFRGLCGLSFYRLDREAEIWGV